MKYTITALVDPFDATLRSDARETLRAYGKLSLDHATSVVDELFLHALTGKQTAIEVDLPNGISPDCLREFHLYLNMAPSNLVSAHSATLSYMITFKLLKMVRSGDYTNSVKTLQDYAELDEMHAMAVTKDVAAGHLTEIEVRRSIGIGAVKKIREHFKMLDHLGRDGSQVSDYTPAGQAIRSNVSQKKKAPVKLKLWTIKYQVKESPLKIIALVLAETPLVASQALMKHVTVEEIVLVTEVEGPFDNGHILTRSMLVS